MEKILVTGANGFLGQHLVLWLARYKYQVFASGKNACRLPAHDAITYLEADITNDKQVKQLAEICQPDVIVHAAALSKPDECNQNADMCLKVNVEATRHLVETSKAFFIYVSTDFVFGEDGPHPESAAPCPLNFYGESKLMAENVVERSGLNYAIVRPAFIYGQTWEGLRPSFLQWVKSNLSEGKRIKVVSDQQRTPTYVTDICKGIHQITQRRCGGAYHLAGNEVMSPYQMAMATAQVLGLDASLIEEVTSETFHEPVRRAKKSGLAIEKAIRELDYVPVSFNEGVRLTFENELPKQ